MGIVDKLGLEVYEDVQKVLARFRVFQDKFVTPIVRQKLLTGDEEYFVVVSFFRTIHTICTVNQHLLEYLRAAGVKCDGNGLDKEVKMGEQQQELSLADVLLQYGPLFEIYTQYFESKEPFLCYLNKKRAVAGMENLEKLIESLLSASPGENQSIESIINSPIDQVSHYRGIINQLLQNTKELNDSEREKLRLAGIYFGNTQRKLNEASALRVNDMLLNKLEEEWDMGRNDFSLAKPGRQLIRQGQLIKSSRKRDVVYQFVLFSDALIYGSPVTSVVGSATTYKLHNVLPLVNIRVGLLSNDQLSTTIEDVTTSNTSTNSLGSAVLSILMGLTEEQKQTLSFNIYSTGDKSFTVKASRPEELCEWWLALTKIVNGANEQDDDADANPSLSPVWQQDIMAKTCSGCDIPFTVIRRRHHCRVCGKVFCGECSKFRVNRPVMGMSKRSLFGGNRRPSLGDAVSSKTVALRSVRSCKPCYTKEINLAPGQAVMDTSKLARRSVTSLRLNHHEEKDPVERQIFGVALNKLDKRTRIVVELLQTEFTYLMGIKTLQNVYIRPLMEDFKSGALKIGGEICRVVKPADLSSMLVFMSDIEYVVTLSERLLEDLRVRYFDGWEKSNGSIGDVFLRIGPLFQLYDEYSSSFEFACSTISSFSTENEAFHEYLETQKLLFENELARAGAQSIHSLLILPIQRIPRYILLLREIQSKTPDDHKDHDQIDQAINLVQSMATHINEKIREREGLVKLFELERRWGKVITNDGNYERKFIHEGPLVKQSRKAYREYEFLLLNDALMYGDVDMSGESVRHHRTLDLTYCSVFDAATSAKVVQTENEQGEHDIGLAIDIIGREKSFRVFAKDTSAKNVWMEKLSTAIQANVEKRSSVAVVSKENAMAMTGVEETQRAPIWVKDGTNCMRCGIQFTLINRPHHCRKCGLSLCNSCTPHRYLLKYVHETRKQRVCVECFDGLNKNSKVVSTAVEEEQKQHEVLVVATLPMPPRPQQQKEKQDEILRARRPPPPPPTRPIETRPTRLSTDSEDGNLEYKV